MKILFVQWNSVGQNDLEEAFIQEGHSLVYTELTKNEFCYGDPCEIEKKLLAGWEAEKPDIVFSVNYSPHITRFCRKRGLRYISWTYDSPYDWFYFVEIIDPCNLIYVFDKEICLELNQAGISSVHYLPMAANTERLDRITADLPFKYDVSFIGSLYLEIEQYSKRSSNLSDYARGYVDALVAAQMKISGYNFIPEVLGPILKELCRVYPRYPIKGDLRSDEFFCAESIINPWITGVERIDLLDAVAEKHGVDLFTHSKEFVLPNLHNHGPANYYEETPKIFKQSKINLNISLRGMKSAVPLRCFDIMGSGGFLLSNFQSGFLDLFMPGEDFIYYESKEDLLWKIGYYLTHEEERQAIARNGHDKVAANHTYRHRVREMLDF